MMHCKKIILKNKAIQNKSCILSQDFFQKGTGEQDKKTSTMKKKWDKKATS